MKANEAADAKASGKFEPDRKDEQRASCKVHIQWQFLYAGSQACKKSKKVSLGLTCSWWDIKDLFFEIFFQSRL